MAYPMRFWLVNIRRLAIPACLVTLSLFSQPSSAQSTTFSYQGELQFQGSPAAGNHDFELALFNSLMGGAQQGPTVNVNAVMVQQGIFTLELDFGDQFSGADRYLEIRVRPTGGGGFTTLSPRHRLLSVPYAVRSLSAAPTPGSPNYIQNTAVTQASSNFNISGTGSANVLAAASHFSLEGLTFISAPDLNNTVLGVFAGHAITSGESNTIYGYHAGDAVDSGNWNSFFGADAGRNTTLGCCNTFVGYRAGVMNATASQNSFFGANAGSANLTGSHNAFFGDNAGKSNTAGSNAIFGSLSGFFNTSGTMNAFFGRSAGLNNTTASDNAFFGAFAGEENIAGANNAFFGSGAGENNTTIAADSGNNNTFIGRNAGNGNTIGIRNTVVGAFAFTANQTGSANTVVGRTAGENTTGDDNAFFGAFAGFENTSGIRNTFIGRNAGNANVDGGNNSTLGFNSDVASGSLNFATAIGAEAIVSTSNTILLGRANGSDTVLVPGLLEVSTLGAAGATALCRNPAFEVAACSSSLRYKSNVVPLEFGMNLVAKLRPVSFEWLSGDPDLGLVAEEVVKVEPLLVTFNSEGAVEGVKYDRVSVVLVNALKEQQARLEAQQAAIEALSRQVEALQALLRHPHGVMEP